MLENKKALQEFLTSNGCQDTEGALAPLEKLFQMVKAGEYSLAPAEEINQGRLAEVVASATNRTVSKVIFSSSGELPEKPKWMNQKDWETSLGNSLRTSLGSSLLNILGISLWTGLGNSVGIILETSFRGSLGTSLEDSPLDSLLVSLFNYIGYCLINDQEQIAKLRPLVEFWGQCLILGFKKDEPETLLVVCK